MLQQPIALIVILFFVSRLIFLKKNKKIAGGEFIFWLAFWILAAVSVLFLKSLDRLVAGLGFSASAINILVYVAVIVLFYLNFRLRLKVEKMDRDITKLARALALDEKKIENIK
jgi:small membrane protein